MPTTSLTSLRALLLIDAATCAAMGLALGLGARPIAALTGLPQPLLIWAGLALLPCHIGDADPLLRRFGAVLDEVFADEFLLVHRDFRALPRVRAVMDALVELFAEERPALEGRRGRI